LEEEVEEPPFPAPVAAEPEAEALEARLDARPDADLASLERDEAAPLAEAAAPFPKMVVEPTVLVKVEPPEVSTETMAEVVMAVEPAPAPLP